MSETARIQALLNDLAAQARGSGLGSYEATDSYEAAQYESYLVSAGMNSFDAKNLAAQAVKVPAIAAQIKGMQAGGQGLGRMLPMNEQPIAAANFQITVKRITAAIAGVDLPFVLFGAQDAMNGYRNIIPALLPAGVTLTSVEIGEPAGAANANRALFTYDDGVNTDTVEVTSSTYPYPSLLNSTNVDLLKMEKIRMQLSNATLTRQFNLDFSTFSNSPFGKGEQNRLSPSSYVRPDQFQAGIVDLDTVVRIDKETSIVSKIIDTAGFTVNYNAFVSKFFRQNTKGGF